MSIKQEMKEVLLKNRFFLKLYNKKEARKKEIDFNNRYKARDTKDLESLKGTKNGQRCFIIGNGPSLTVEDLEKIGNEDSFASNRIYRIFNRTKWRPTYYYSQDKETLIEVMPDLTKVIRECNYVFLNSSVKNAFKDEKIDNLYFVFINDRDRDKLSGQKKPLFSDDIPDQIYEGNTVTYGSIQIAVYLGYSEIYLLGVDHNYSATLNEKGEVIKDEKVKNYMPGLEGRLTNIPDLYKTTLAYRTAREECEKRGVKICNATRGGKLEEFDRVDFDSLF